MRKVIFHYHLFKNAGTSLDSQLQANVPEGQWLTQEFPAPLAPNRKGVAEWIQAEQDALVFSSHTAYLPPPELPGIKVLPVIFIRHPIDRIASVHAFEREQASDEFGAVLARHTDLAGYIESRLALPFDRLCRNFHSQRFAFMYGEAVGPDRVRAEKALANLPFVGVVERFEESLARLQQWLHAEGFNFTLKPVKENVTRDIDKSLVDKLDDIRQEIGDNTYQKLLAANEEDLLLYEQACKLLCGTSTRNK